jgi:hypothetical protein
MSTHFFAEDALNVIVATKPELLARCASPAQWVGSLAYAFYAREALMGVVLNSVIAREEDAVILGVDLLKLPALLEDQVARNAANGWNTLFSDHLKRCHPGITDFEVLQKKFGCRDKDQLARMADLALRQAPELSSESDPDFDRYVAELQEIVGYLIDKRSAWIPLAEVDDPMHYDEFSLREVECLVFIDLRTASPTKASSRQLKVAHCVAARNHQLPLAEVLNGKLNYFARYHALQTIMEAMKKRYFFVCQEMDRNASPTLILLFNQKLELLESLGMRVVAPNWRCAIDEQESPRISS